IALMLGIPPERKDDFKRWSDALIGGTSPDFDYMSAAGTLGEMWQFFAEMIEMRRGKEGSDLICMLVNGSEPLSSDELLMFCMLLRVAGNETTTNLLGNWMLALDAHRDELSRLWADPSLLPAAVEEALRYDSPVHMLGRTTTAAIEVEGVKI